MPKVAEELGRTICNRYECAEQDRKHVDGEHLAGLTSAVVQADDSFLFRSNAAQQAATEVASANPDARRCLSQAVLMHRLHRLTRTGIGLGCTRQVCFTPAIIALGTWNMSF